jgi:hypothetical protein
MSVLLLHLCAKEEPNFHSILILEVLTLSHLRVRGQVVLYANLIMKNVSLSRGAKLPSIVTKSSSRHHHIITTGSPCKRRWAAAALDANAPGEAKSKMRMLLRGTQQNAMSKRGLTGGQARSVALRACPHRAAKHNAALPGNFTCRDARATLPIHKPTKKCPYHQAVGNNYNYYFPETRVHSPPQVQAPPPSQSPPQVQAPPPGDLLAPHVGSLSDASSPESSFSDAGVVFDHEVEEANQQPSPESQQQSTQSSKSASSLSSASLSGLSSAIPIKAFPEDVEPYLRLILQNMSSTDIEEV